MAAVASNLTVSYQETAYPGEKKMADASSCLPQAVFATNVMMHHAGLPD